MAKFSVSFVHGRNQADLAFLKKFEPKSYATCMEFYHNLKTVDGKAGVLIIDLGCRLLPSCNFLSIGQQIESLLEKLIAERFPLPIILLAHRTNYPTAIQLVRKAWDAEFYGVDFVCKSTRGQRAATRATARLGGETETEEKILEAISRASDHYYNKPHNIHIDEIEVGFSRLTERQLFVLDRIMNGKSSSEIGQELGISVKTVEAHRMGIKDKTRTDDVADLLRMYLDFNELQATE